MRCRTKVEFGTELENRRALNSLTSVTEAYSLIKSDMNRLMRPTVSIIYLLLGLKLGGNLAVT